MSGGWPLAFFALYYVTVVGSGLTLLSPQPACSLTCLLPTPPPRSTVNHHQHLQSPL